MLQAFVGIVSREGLEVVYPEHAETVRFLQRRVARTRGQAFCFWSVAHRESVVSVQAALRCGERRAALEMLDQATHEGGRLGVRYHRVLYRQDLGGQTVEYNSDQPTASIPAEALPYAGLRDNNFSFWVGADNQVLELVGFTESLQRCVQRMAADQRPAVLSGPCCCRCWPSPCGGRLVAKTTNTLAAAV